MNKNIIYISVALIVGLLGGFLLFGGGSADKATNNAKDTHDHSEYKGGWFLPYFI